MKLQKLTDKIERLFNISELRDLCFRLSVEYDDLSGENRKDKVRELVQFCNRRGKIDELMHLCRLLRPNESWDSEPFKVAQSGRQYIRTVALAAAKHEVDKFVSDHPDFHVLVNSQNTPTEYIFRFKASSVAPPLDEHSDPVPIFEHKVHFFLPPDYPKRPPEIHWLSPIYHCNIDPESGKLGIGILEENYLPNLGLGRFCKMIVEIASFHNYEFTHSKNAQAKKWLNSPKGQEAIREIGGYQLHERLNSESEDLHPRMHELNKRLLHQSNQNHSKMSPLEIQERLKNQKLVEYAIRLIPKADYHKEGLIGKDERSYVFIGDYYEQRSRSLREILANLWIGDAFDKVANANTEWLGIIFEVGELNYRKFDLMPATWKSMFRIVSDPKRLGIIEPTSKEKESMGDAPRDYYSHDQRYWYARLTSHNYNKIHPHTFLSSCFGIDWFCFDGRGITKGQVPSRIFLVKNSPLTYITYSIQDLGLPNDNKVLI